MPLVRQVVAIDIEDVKGVCELTPDLLKKCLRLTEALFECLGLELSTLFLLNDFSFKRYRVFFSHHMLP